MEISKGNKTALVIGATSLVGDNCIQLLLEHKAYQKVIVLSAEPLKLQHERLEVHQVAFDKLSEYRSLIKADDVFCCSGISIKREKGKGAFYKLDYNHAYQIAKAAVEDGANQFLLASSLAADPNSLLFYARVKGELEVAIKRLPYWAIHVFRPSVLLEERPKNNWGEALANRLASGFENLTGSSISKYRPIEAEIVAKAMVEGAQRLEEGIFIYESGYLQKLAEKEQKKLLE